MFDSLDGYDKAAKKNLNEKAIQIYVIKFNFSICIIHLDNYLFLFNTSSLYFLIADNTLPYSVKNHKISGASLLAKL